VDNQGAEFFGNKNRKILENKIQNLGAGKQIAGSLRNQLAVIFEVAGRTIFAIAHGKMTPLRGRGLECCARPFPGATGPQGEAGRTWKGLSRAMGMADRWARGNGVADFSFLRLPMISA